MKKKFPESGEECVHCSVYFSFGLNGRGAGGEITFGGTNPERYIDPLVYHPIYDYYGMYVFLFFLEVILKQFLLVLVNRKKVKK